MSGRSPRPEWNERDVRVFRMAPTSELGELLAGRPIEPVLQSVGQAVLVRLGAGPLTVAGARLAVDDAVASYARRCQAELAERGWTGDDELVRELSAALGEPAEVPYPGAPWPLRPVPVDLADLGEFLDGDPTQGHGVIDLETGDVLPPGIFDVYDLATDFPDLDEESDSYDPDRWLRYDPDSSSGYRDMTRFTESLDDERLQRRLWRALDGRGAFRRFRDALADAPEGTLRAWLVYRDERSLGRSRAFLAEAGYRAAPNRPDVEKGA